MDCYYCLAYIYFDLYIVDVNVCSVLFLYSFVVVRYLFVLFFSFLNIWLFSFDVRGE